MSLSCTDFKEDLSSFVDGELDQHKQSALAVHLSDCSICKRDHDDFKHVGRALQTSAAESQTAAPDIWAAISTKLPGVCECVQDDLSAYLDGELIASAKEGVSQHLEQCAECHAKFQDLSGVTRLLSGGLKLPESMDIDIWAGVKARLNDDCSLIRSELSAFIDREVATLRHRAIASHLTECAECKEEFVGLSTSGEMLRSSYLPAMAEDFDLWPAIQSKMSVVPFERKDKSTVLQFPTLNINTPARRLAAVAAAVVAGVAATMIYFNPMQPNTEMEIITAEAYLIDQSLGEPSDVAEAVVYEHAQP